MTEVQNRIAWGKFVTMQQRARGLKVPNETTLVMENRTLTHQLQAQLDMIISLREELNYMAKQRDSYAAELIRLQGVAK